MRVFLFMNSSLTGMIDSFAIAIVKCATGLIAAEKQVTWLSAFIFVVGAACAAA
jgi:hypothetical protein